MLTLPKYVSAVRRGSLLVLAVLITASVTVATVTPPSTARAAYCNYYRTQTTFERPWEGGYHAEPRTHYKSNKCYVGVNQSTIMTMGSKSYYPCAQFRVRVFYGYNNNEASPWKPICGNPNAKPPESAVEIARVDPGREYRIETRILFRPDDPLQFQAFD